LKAVRVLMIHGYDHPKHGPQPALARGGRRVFPRHCDSTGQGTYSAKAWQAVGSHDGQKHFEEEPGQCRILIAHTYRASHIDLLEPTDSLTPAAV
jgi:hypothetical protein